MVNQNNLPLAEAFDIISCTTILGVFYGLAFSLYCLCTSSLYLNLQNPDKRRRTMFSLGFISFLFFCATGYLALSAQVIQLAYINHADFPRGPWEYELLYGSVVQPYQITGVILVFIIDVLTMGIQIWRLWIIWSATRYAVVVTIPPVLLLLAYIALDSPIDVDRNAVSLHIPDKSVNAMATSAFTMSASFTALVTGLIAARLLLAQRQFTKVMGMSGTVSASPYLSIIGVLVESYALESVWSLAAAIAFAFHNTSRILFQENDSMVKVIAYLLIVYRVQQGKGWTKQTEEKLTSLQFGQGAQSATDEADGLGSEVLQLPPCPK